jgi:periplasmic divalent cation tolerance protein
MHELRLVLCTFPDAVTARQIGTVLVEKQLAACVNLIPAVESVYRWQGRVETSAEVLAVFKTSAAVFPAFERELAALHPYDVPEIIGIEPAGVSQNYAAWVMECVHPPGKRTGMNDLDAPTGSEH